MTVRQMSKEETIKTVVTHYYIHREGNQIKPGDHRCPDFTMRFFDLLAVVLETSENQHKVS